MAINAIELEGLEPLKAELQALKITNREIVPVLRSAAEPIVQAAQPKIARGKGSKWAMGEHLQDNIDVESAGGVVGVTAAGGLQNGPFFYGKYYEYGTKRQKARSPIRTAAAEVETEVSSRLEQGIEEILNGKVR